MVDFKKVISAINVIHYAKVALVIKYTNALIVMRVKTCC